MDSSHLLVYSLETIYIGVLHLNWVIRYYIILSGSAGTPKCITNVDIIPTNITCQMYRVCSNYCSFTSGVAVFTTVLLTTSNISTHIPILTDVFRTLCLSENATR